MTIGKASGRWNGGFKDGKGVMAPEHGGELPFSVGTRFEGVVGTNPEEVLGAALAGCFSMALSLGLERAGLTPKQLTTRADVKLERGEGGFSITSIALELEAVVPGADPAKVEEIAVATKTGCPVSKALAAVPEITLKTRVTT